jgi:hypothetical protein
MVPVLTTLLGGLLAISGALVGIHLGDRRERNRWLRDSQWQASSALLSALQLLNRRMINVAYLDGEEARDQASPTVASFNEATVEWNAACYSALLVAPPEVAQEIPRLDQEVDRLLDLAVARRWTRAEFRQERAPSRPPEDTRCAPLCCTGQARPSMSLAGAPGGPRRLPSRVSIG